MTSLDEKVPDSSTDLSKTIAPSMHTRRRLVHVRELDGVRGIAALVVLFHHVFYTSVPVEGWGRGVRLLSAVSHYGFAGVDLFFVLSGFLISSLLIEDRGSPRYYHDFYWKRALRILPLYFVCLAGVRIFYPHSGTYVLASALFIANFAWLFHIDPAGPFWTLAIEEQFYLIWPTVVRRRSIDAISRWAMAIGFGAVALRLMAAYTGHHNYQFTFFRCDGLAMGAWLACRFERWNRLNVQSTREKSAWAGGLVVALVLALVSNRMHGGPRTEAYSAAFLQTAITLFAGSLIALLLVHRGKSYLSIFRSRLLTFFGLISYAFYMTHWYILYLYDHFRGPLPEGDLGAYALRFFTVLGVTVAVALISRYLLELPASSLRRYVLQPAVPQGAEHVHKR